MRKRHNLESRMERCRDYQVTEPELRKGMWRKTGRSLMLEIGCGKGSFTCALASAEPGKDLIAIEKVPDAMILAMERAKSAGLENVCFLDYDAARLREIFSPGELDRIYINFCDPWPKSRDAKFRLTAPSFLRIYADLLPHGGEIRFKTDNDALFDWSLQQFEQEKWEIRTLTRDLHAKRDGYSAEEPKASEGQEQSEAREILTDYERRFMEAETKIKMLCAVKGTETLDGSAGVPPRLRDAALADARAYQTGIRTENGADHSDRTEELNV